MKRLASVHAAWGVVLYSALAAPAPAQDVTVTGLDGMQWTGSLSALDAAEVRVAGGAEPAVIALDEVAEIAWLDCVPQDATTSGVRFLLNGGGVLAGELIDSGHEQLTARTALAERVVLPYGELAGIRLRGERQSAGAKLFNDAFASRLAGYDVLIALDDGDAKALRGRLQSLGPEEGVFVFNNRERTFRTSRVQGVVFAAGHARTRAGAADVTLASGDRFSSTQLVLTAAGLRVATTFGATWTVPIDALCQVRWHNPRAVYLDALPTERETSSGILHPAWPIVRNANVRHGPLRIGEKTYGRGIGVHARAELNWALDGEYATFAATIGIDDAVGPGGNARFVVLGDGRELFDSGPLSGRDGPRPVRLAIENVQRLTLRVDPGANADVGDWADWAEARVILPRAKP